MTSRKVIIEYLQYKNSKIKEAFNEDYINQKDLDEIEESWSEQDCDAVLYSMHVLWIATDNGKNNDGMTCPWCIRQNRVHHGYDFCHDCQYGQRHGICDEGGLYSKLRGQAISKNIEWLSTLMSKDEVANIFQKKSNSM